MSFSSDIKEDLVRAKRKDRRLMLSELSGLTVSCGSVYIGRGTGAVYTTESVSVAKCIVSIATELYELNASVEKSEVEQRKNPLLSVTLTGKDAEKLLYDTGLLVRTDDGGIAFDGAIPKNAVRTAEQERIFLRGAFLGSGSCTNPSRAYHLEIVTRTESFAKGIIALLEKNDIRAHFHKRSDRFVVYTKGDDVSGVLALLGANNAALAFENVRAEKDFRNYLNRTSNCETANIDKTVFAAVRQKKAIDTIERHMELRDLPDPLYEAAMLRLSHPESTLQELAELAEIGKSGMNHRFTRLINLAQELEP